MSAKFYYHRYYR